MFQPVYYMYVCLYQWLGEQGVMLDNLIKLENGPSKSMWNDKKWTIENFKIIEKTENRPLTNISSLSLLYFVIYWKSSESVFHIIAVHIGSSKLLCIYCNDYVYWFDICWWVY